ncbi:hypothetical protein [Halofilum ochraceum]|uniref:hypothetical protein n=1 Tax=Halofilum ochraceum TaxID=1611323 RepID=UPI0008D8DEEA|nr:hypothetical protein [Halofilum ochraceum]
MKGETKMYPIEKLALTESSEDTRLNTRTRVALYLYDRTKAGQDAPVTADSVTEDLPGADRGAVSQALHSIYRERGLAKGTKDNGQPVYTVRPSYLRDVEASLRHRPRRPAGTARDQEQAELIHENDTSDTATEAEEPAAAPVDLDAMDELVEDAITFLDFGRIDRVKAKLDRLRGELATRH